MTEKASNQPEQPIKVEIGKTFKPFEELKVLPTLDIALKIEHKKKIATEVPLVLSREIEIERIKLIIGLSLTTLGPRRDETINPEEIYESLPSGRGDSGAFESPLGAATMEFSYRDSKIIVNKAPLVPIIISNLKKSSEYLTLRKYQLELGLGDKKYHLECPNPYNEGPIEESLKDIQNEAAKSGKGFNFFNDELLNDDKHDSVASIVLPYDPVKLSGIEVKLVERDY